MPQSQLDAWKVGVTKSILRREIWKRIENQAIATVTAEPSREYLDRRYEQDIQLLLQDANVDSYETFAIRQNRLRDAQIRALQSPSDVDEIYEEMLAPLSIAKDDLTSIMDSYEQFEITMNEHIESLDESRLPLDEREYRANVEGWLDSEMKQATLFDVDLTVSEEDRQAYHEANGPAPIHMRAPDMVVDGAIRQERLQAGRERWLSEAVESADIQIVDERFHGLNLNPDEEP
jgi:hypothetical protein